MDAYPPMPPKQVTVSCVPLTSYGFLHTPPLASGALAIRIIFPLVRVTPLSFKWTGLPASLGKHKKSWFPSFFLIPIATSLRQRLLPLHGQQVVRSFQLEYAYKFLHDAQIFP